MAATQLAPAAEAVDFADSLEDSNNAAANCVAILNDTHIGQDHGSTHPHPTNLRTAIEQILGLKTRPAAVLINGDLAMSVGTPGDYRTFVRLIEPLREAGLPLHLTLGNHDNRDEFLRALADFPSVTQFRDHRHNGVIDL
ncbi:MAG: metallophosphoesterase, partial [Pirellulaceae bacterium]|nr:metallophosphoesterase [Pirellulaceae bacterium]